MIVYLRLACSALCIFLSVSYSWSQNPIFTENALAGNPPSEWELDSPDQGDTDIQGFADGLSINTGETIEFKIDVKAPATNFSIKIFRLGYYAGDGARLIADLGNTFVGTAQPAPGYEVATGKTDCSNWSVSASWTATAAVSGIYLALLERNDNGGKSHIAFVVRDDSGAADILFKTSDATWQAYNGYGGNSLYVNNSGTPVPGLNHASKVSYNRPFFTRGGGGGSGSSEDWLFNAEYPMIRWMERNGYNVSYTTDLDMARDPNQLQDGSNALKYDVFISVGHDEYWSLLQRNRVEAARDAGMHLAFFSGNEVYWKTRWEDNHRTLVCYKEGTLGENVCNTDCDPDPNEWTGLWRDGCGSADSNDGCNPENSLTGQISWGDATGSIEVPDDFKDHRFWRNTSVASLTTGNSVTLPNGVLGYEFDFEQPGYAFANPNGRVLLSNTILGGKLHKMSLYKHASGALVFGAGTVQWPWGLDSNHDRGNEAPSLDMQQATVNLFAEMGVQPGSLQGDLTAAAASADITGAVTTVIAPVSAEIIPVSSPYQVSGTAADAAGVVAGVEVSVDGGTTWEVASGTETWTYSWTPQTENNYTLRVRSFDDLGNIGDEASVNVTVGPPAPPSCTCTIWPSQTTIPGTITENDSQPVELGVRFQSTVAGYVTGIRFYKGPANLGTHSGSLWTSTGTLLATVTFTGETADGWQEALFSNPVAILANTTYVASYHAPQGNYSVDGGYFATQGFISDPLKALADGEDGANGVYQYGSGNTFPTQTYQSANYYVDVVFETEVGPDVTNPTVQLVSPADGSSGVSINTAPSVTFSESMDESTLSGVLTMAGVVGTTTYNAINKTLSFIPNAPLAYNTVYSLSLAGTAADLAGNTLGTGVVWSFTTSAPPPPPPTDGPGGPILIISSTTNDFSRYPTEILRAQGFNEFTAEDESAVDANLLGNYQVVILGDFTPSAQLVSDLTAWVNGGGTLIAFRPNAQLHTLLGITAAGGSIAEGYILVNDATSEGTGIVNETIQYHGSADQYTLDGASSLAALYSDAATATAFAAITVNDVGANGGKAYAFAYDLARSVVFTRQGNPAWEGQNRDVNAVGSDGVIRPNDLFYGDAPSDPQPDWVNLDKVQIPQADEQLHLLSNMIVLGNLHSLPLPRFWMLPNNVKAAVVMTGDDHAGTLTDDFFNDFIALSPQGCSVDDWECIRGSTYLYPNTPQTDGDMLAFQNQGFEVSIHINTGCGVWTPSSLTSSFTTDLSAFAVSFPSIDAPTTERNHCIAWSDYDTQPQVMFDNGMRLDVNYYYWPGSWIQDRPGLFTGSAMPMRFATSDGELIDVYQVTTQFTDESGQTYPTHYTTLIDNALGAEGYYGVFCANFHTDNQSSRALATGLATYAQNNGVPVVSSKQMLTWLDGRNASAFENISWATSTLSFDVSVGSGANNLYGMVPANSESGPLLSMTFGGSALSYGLETIKGIEYAFFPTGAGSYTAVYGLDETAPVISYVQVQINPNGTVTITWDTDEPANSAITLSTSADLSNATLVSEANLVTSHSILLESLAPGTTYFFQVSSADAAANSTSEPATSPYPSFDTPTPLNYCFTDDLLSDFELGTATDLSLSDGSGGEISLSPVLSNDFSEALPYADWGSFEWGGGGTSTIAGGILSVDGARFNSIPEGTTYGPGSSLEFVATFGAASFQHIGFGGGSNLTGTGGIYNGESPWAMFSTGNQTSILKARTFPPGGPEVQFDIPGSAALIGSSHTYRIDWLLDGSFKYYVDGSLVHTSTGIVNTGMRPAINDYNLGGLSIQVDQIEVSPPYLLAGSFESRVYDAGVPKEWGTMEWDADIPANTSITLKVRVGNSLPLVSAFIPVAVSGNDIGLTGQYIQYKADFSTSDALFSPELQAVRIECADPTQSAPVVILHPQNIVTCADVLISFTSEAAGFPASSLQWEVSIDAGANFNPIAGAISSPLEITPNVADDGKIYRAVWTNIIGSATSSDALLTVNPTPDGTLQFSTPGICDGEPVTLQYAAGSGAEPFDLIINGSSYNGISSGASFNSIVETESLFNPASIGVSQTADNGNTELGLQFSSGQPGQITGIRFYQTGTDVLTFNGTLWTTLGAQLATGNVTTDGTSGWKTILFASPVSIDANTSYVASYTSPNPNYYAFSADGLSTPIINGNLTGEASSFSAGGSFPNGASTANYWVDVLFTGAGTLTFDFTNVTDDNGCALSGSPISSITQSIYPNPAGALSSLSGIVCENADAEITFDASGGTGPFDLIINGTTYSGVQDGIPFQATPPGNAIPPTSIWTSTPTFGSYNDGDPIETGVKFQSSLPGQITSVRFYKGFAAPMPGGSLVRIWNSGGTELASASFTLGSETGWQVINLLSPLNIDANTTYIASVYSPGGDYAAQGPGSLINAVENYPLKALADAEAGGNGVFNYGSAGFPTTSVGQNNYGVDVVFSSMQESFSLTSITDVNGCSVVGSPLQSLTVNLLTAPEIPSVVLTRPSDCTVSDGSIEVTATGDGTIEYSIDNGSNWQLTGLFENLPSGTYNVLARFDQSSCETAWSGNPFELEALPQTITVNYAGTGTGVVNLNPDQLEYACGTSVELTAVPDPGSIFTGWSGDLTGSNLTENITVSGPKNITATFDLAPQFFSDDFDRANLDTAKWTFVNPLGDGWVAMTGQNTSDAFLELSIPQGDSHDPWDINRSARVMQEISDGDFEIEVKFESEPDPTKKYQNQGVIIEESENNWLRFDLFSDGVGLKVFASTSVNGSPSSKINISVTQGSATYLRINRTNNTWTFEYSGDGTTWTVAGSFSHSMAVSRVGPFVANHATGGADAPAFTAQVDYFFNTAAPLTSEDDGAEVDVWEPFIHTIQTHAGVNELTINWYTDEPSIGAIDFGATQAYGTTETEAVPTYYHSLTISGLVAGNTYNYRLRSTDGLAHEAVTENFIITFDPDGPVIDVWYGDTQDFGVHGNPQEFWINILGNVSDPDGVQDLYYTLDGGSPVSLSIGPDARRLENEGDFNVDPDWTTLSTGPHTIVITATDAISNQSTKTITLNYTGGNIWPTTYTADWTTLTTDADPATPDPAIQTIAQVVDGKWSSENGEIRTVEPGYDRLVAIGDYLWDDYQVKVPITINSIVNSGFGTGLLFRWGGHTTTPVSCTQPQCGYLPLGAIGWIRNSKLEFYNTGVQQPFSASIGTTYWFLMEVESTAGGPTYRLKVWEDGQSEPAAWNLENQESPGSPISGSLLLISHQADASFGTVEVTPLPASPNVPPVAVDDNASVQVGTSLAISVLNNDSDPDGLLNKASVTVVNPPTNGSITNINPVNGQVTYQHDGSATTSDSFTYTVEDNDGAVSNVATVNLTITPEPVLAFASDDFCDPSINTSIWTVNPLGGSTIGITGSGTTDAFLQIDVPGGPEHQMFKTIKAPHILQPMNDVDFGLEVKFESSPSVQYQEQGVIVKQDDNNFLRLEMYSTSSNTFLYAASYANTVATNYANTAIGVSGLTPPLYMRVNRVGNNWTLSYSFDGSFTDGGSVNFSYTMNATGIGPYAGNATGGSSPAYTGLIDYFENLNDPILNEDACGAACSITDLTAVQPSACDGQAGTYSQELLVTFENAPATGTLDVNGQSFAIGVSPQTVILTGLVADGLPVDVTVAFSDEPLCTLTETALFIAPELAVVNNVDITNPSNCGLTDGDISISASLSVGTLEYSMDGGSNWQSASTFAGLGAGPYTVLIRGLESGCEIAWGGNPVVLSDLYDLDGDGVNCDTDCDDTDPLEFPGQTWYLDADGDGYSDGTSVVACERPVGYYVASELTATTGDCNDGDLLVNPAAQEICDGIDNDCDGFIDDNDPSITGQATWYADTDGDGFGDPAVPLLACNQPVNHVADNTDCDDTDPEVYPGADEIYDGIDNDCDGLIDGDDPDVGGQSLNGQISISSGCSGRTIRVRVYDVDGTVMLFELSTTIDGGGNFTVGGIPPGFYDIFVKMEGHLQEALGNQEVLAGATGMNFGFQRPGDLNGNNLVSAVDLAGLIGAFGSQVPDQAYNPLADFNCTGNVNSIDLSGLLPNYNKQGQTPGNITP